MKTNKMKIKNSTSDKILNITVFLLMALLLIVIVYPLIYVISCSFSSGSAVSQGRVFLFPVEPSLTGYKIVFDYKQIWVGYANSILYTFVGTALSIILTIAAAYPLSRRNLRGKGFLMTLFIITMFFSGGIIPKYILMVKLHLTNTRWSIILSSALSVYNMIIMRTFFMNSIPEELHEAAVIDGISDFGYLFKVVLPLSKPIVAVIVLYSAVAHWNSYFDAMMYLRDRSMYPLQLILREILNASKVDLSQITDPELLAQMRNATDLMKYSLIVISSLPVIIMYPFVQKYFEKGIMIGSVKG